MALAILTCKLEAVPNKIFMLDYIRGSQARRAQSITTSCCSPFLHLSSALLDCGASEFIRNYREMTAGLKSVLLIDARPRQICLVHARLYRAIIQLGRSTTDFTCGCGCHISGQVPLLPTH